MENEKIREYLNQAWDALEKLPVVGYSARARINKAQECILAIFNIINRTEPEKEQREEGGDGDD